MLYQNIIMINSWRLNPGVKEIDFSSFVYSSGLISVWFRALISVCTQFCSSSNHIKGLSPCSSCAIISQIILELVDCTVWFNAFPDSSRNRLHLPFCAALGIVLLTEWFK